MLLRAARRCRRQAHSAAAAAASAMQAPDADQLYRFRRDGFLHIPGALSAAECDAMRARMDALLDGFDPEEHRSVFSTKEQTRVSDEYFLGSGDQVRFFFEEDAFDASGAMRQAPKLCVNKVGHSLHVDVPEFRAASWSPFVRNTCLALGQRDPDVVQSMYIFKQPRIGGEVGAHQDGTFLYTDPQSVIGFWWALEDATLENGCLWAAPGSHALGVSRHFKRNASNTGTEFEPAEEPAPFDLSGGEPLPVAKGDLVLIHSSLVHWSHDNRSDKSRHAYAIHVVDGHAHYPESNWLQRAPEKAKRLW